MQRGVEVLGDAIKAVELQLEELKVDKQRQIKQLEQKQIDLKESNNLARSLTGRDLLTYASEYSTLTQAIDRAKNKTLEQYLAELKIQLPASSMAIIQRKFSGAVEFKAPKRPLPVRSFTSATMKKIEDHHQKIEPHLKKLMDAAIEDDINLLPLFAGPVFIQGDGHIYNHQTLNEFLEQNNGKAICPKNQDIRYTAADIIPCNTLFDAVMQLIKIIDLGDIDQILEIQKYTMVKKPERKTIPENFVPLIEMAYEQMPNKHKALFNIICRDPVSGNIIDNPVLLPDGYVYDRSGADYLLENEGGFCRKNPEVRFTKEEITPCYFVKNVLLQLKENIEEQIKLKKQAPAPDAGDSKQVSAKLHEPLRGDKASEIVSLEKRAVELQQIIEKSKKELEAVQSQLTLLRGDKPSSSVRP